MVVKSSLSSLLSSSSLSKRRSPLVGAANALEVLASVGTSTSPTSTGTKAVTGVGFQPKVVMPFGIEYESNGAATQGILSLGVADADSQASLAVSTRNSVTTSLTNRRHTSSAIVSSLDSAGGSNTVASLSSLDSDGFTLNWSTVQATARILNHIALGGSSLEVSLVQCQMNNTNAAQSFAHGLTGGAPECVLFFSVVNTFAPPNTSQSLSMSIGAWSGSSNWLASIFSGNALTTTVTRRALLDNACMGNVSDAGVRRSFAVTGVDETNVSVGYVATSNTNQNYFWMLSLRGCTAKVGTFDCNGSLDPVTISCPGVTPKLFLPVFVYSGVGSINTVQNSLLLSIGASDGTNNVSCGITDQNNLTGSNITNARRYQSSTSLVQYSVGGSLGFEATATFDGESVILDPTTNSDSSYGEGAYLILGE